MMRLAGCCKVDACDKGTHLRPVRRVGALEFAPVSLEVGEDLLRETMWNAFIDGIPLRPPPVPARSALKRIRRRPPLSLDMAAHRSILATVGLLELENCREGRLADGTPVFKFTSAALCPLCKTDKHTGQGYWMIATDASSRLGTYRKCARPINLGLVVVTPPVPDVWEFPATGRCSGPFSAPSTAAPALSTSTRWGCRMPGRQE